MGTDRCTPLNMVTMVTKLQPFRPKLNYIESHTISMLPNILNYYFNAYLNMKIKYKNPG